VPSAFQCTLQLQGLVSVDTNQSGGSVKTSGQKDGQITVQQPKYHQSADGKTLANGKVCAAEDVVAIRTPVLPHATV
jgi:hypothetical protein